MTRMDTPHVAGNLVRNRSRAAHGDDPLPRLLLQLVARAGPPATIDRATSRPWASALFEGRRHDVRLVFGGDDAAPRRAAFIDGLSDAEWTLSGHFVADICVDAIGAGDTGPWLDLSALTIRDW